MSDKEKPPHPMADWPFDEAMARLLQTDPKEIADAHQRVREGQEQVTKYAEERRDSIRSGVRRAPNRFRI